MRRPSGPSRTVQGEDSYRIESQPDQVTLSEMMKVLRKMYGSHIPDATEIYVPRWNSDPLFRGSYSNWPIGLKREHFDNVRAPLVNTLFFTGEHTSEMYFGYVHGAMISGEETGNNIARCILDKCVDYLFHPDIDKDGRIGGAQLSSNKITKSIMKETAHFQA
jgi:polyamine oxidase